MSRRSYRVIYTWRGERHHGGHHSTAKSAKAEVAEFRAKGFNAWVEPWGAR